MCSLHFRDMSEEMQLKRASMELQVIELFNISPFNEQAFLLLFITKLIIMPYWAGVPAPQQEYNLEY